ncbi:MAG: class I SAM-dependent methyltransferase [Archangiaceae bacterium]|nr:class I SAM-dependent methyltransferase [Archangiaceae bacterium]
MTSRSWLSTAPLLLVTTSCSHPMHAMHHGEGMHHRFDDPASWSARFDDPGRDAWQRPDEVIAALALKPDARVADLGAATGYFSVRLARALPAGKVFGVDLEPTMVAYLNERAKKESLANVVGVEGSATSPNLPEAVDLILVVDTYHHLGDRPAYFSRAAEKLSPGGRVAIIDFRPGDPMGPPDALKLPPEQVKAELVEAGYRPVGEHVFLPNQYFLVFARP